MSSSVRVRIGSTNAADSSVAGRELAEQVGASDAALTMLFASARYDLRALSAPLRAAAGGAFVGCTTAGEIGPEGYASGTACAFSIVSPELEANPYLISPLRSFDPARLSAVLDCARDVLDDSGRRLQNARAFGLLLVDGMSVMEEHVVAMLGNGLAPVPIVGGSAGDDLAFERSQVMLAGDWFEDAAVFVLVATRLPFATIKTQHFCASEERVVITRARPEERLVYEINGRPAAEEYARLIGVPLTRLTPETYSRHPLMLRSGGEYYVRSIQRTNADSSLTFFCAIDEGVVLRIGSGQNLVQDLRDALERAAQTVGDPLLTIGCDCILRRIEIGSQALGPSVNDLFRRARVVGFSTYGEQFGSLHVNQTFTGVTIGEMT